jgi:hypothetical protein
MLVIAAAYRNCLRILKSDFNYGRLVFSCFIVILLYNFTEAGFKGMSLISFMFFLTAVDTLGFSQSEQFTKVAFASNLAWVTKLQANPFLATYYKSPLSSWPRQHPWYNGGTRDDAVTVRSHRQGFFPGMDDGEGAARGGTGQEHPPP